jgi:hypothetical protein
MESGTTGYSPECEIVEVIFAKNLTGCRHYFWMYTGFAEIHGKFIQQDITKRRHLTPDVRHRSPLTRLFGRVIQKEEVWILG